MLATDLEVRLKASRSFVGQCEERSAIFFKSRNQSIVEPS